MIVMKDASPAIFFFCIVLAFLLLCCCIESDFPVDVCFIRKVVRKMRVALEGLFFVLKVN